MDVQSYYGAMARAATSGIAGSGAAAASGRAGTAQSASAPELGKDGFLRLLITQLRYQDPINPVKDQEFIAQLAQFSALEQMHNMSTQMERLADAQLQLGGIGQAVTLLGRTVVIFDPETAGFITGRVEAVQLEDGTPMLVIGERRFSMWDVVEVRPN